MFRREEMYAIGTTLGVNEFFYTHVGTYFGNGMVFHNHWRNGAEIVSLEEFSTGKEIIKLSGGVGDIYEFLARVQESLSRRREFSLLSNNCEHAVSFAREGEAYSPQLASYGLIGLIGIGAYVLSRG